MTVIYREHDGDLNFLAGKKVGVIGYGNMGRPVALNLRDSGIQVIVSEPSADRQTLARQEGFPTAAPADTVKNTDVIMLLVRDEAMAEIYLDQVSPHLRRGQTLIFSSAYNVAFGFIEAPPFVDVGLIAPRTLGAVVRERYERGQGFYSFVAVGQDASGQAWRVVLAVAKALGALRDGAIEIAFEQEAQLDLFIEQAILPAFHHLMITAAGLLMRAGYPPEMVLTDLYLSGAFSTILEQAAEHGLMHALKLSSLASQYGTLSRYERFNELKMERLMEVALEEIRSGRFTQEWAKEYAANYPRLKQLMKNREAMELWELEQQTLELLGRGGDPF